MSHRHTPPPVPPASRSPKGPGSRSEPRADDAPGKKPDNVAEQGETANIRQNTTNAGYFHGRRVK